MSQIATTIEQSKRLMEAGVNKESADMMWTNRVETCDDWGHFVTVEEETEHLEIAFSYFILNGVARPAWSLSALWQMVHELDKTYEFPTTLSSDDLIELLVKTICFRREYQLPKE